MPSAEGYSGLLKSYMEQRASSEEVRERVAKLFRDAGDSLGPDLLDRLLEVASLVDSRIGELNQQLRGGLGTLTPLKDIGWMVSDVPGWLQDAVRLAYGRTYCQRRMYDEALETLAGLELGQVCDPASLLFYRASAQHHLLKKSDCMANLKQLLERESELPVRYRQTALLMQADIAPLKDDSLDEVARLMTDVQRRLDLGRAGQKVRDEEEDIIRKLDKMIEQAEEQAKKMQQQQASQDQSQSKQSSSSALEESQNAGGKGPGDVDPKDVKQNSGWGNLPPAQRQESLQRLTEELPSHYRDVIEAYFRQLAKDRSK